MRDSLDTPRRVVVRCFCRTTVCGQNATTIEGGVVAGCARDGRQAAVAADPAADLPLSGSWCRGLTVVLDLGGRWYDGRNDHCGGVTM